MCRSAPTQALRPIAHLPPRRLSVVCDLPSTGVPLPSTFAALLQPAGSPVPSSPLKLPSLGYPLENLREVDCIIVEPAQATTTPQRNTTTTSNIRQERAKIVSSAFTSTPPVRDAFPTYVIPDADDDFVVTDANFKAQHHRHGECLAHPRGCDCEKVQRPTMGQDEAWQVMALRFKAVHDPLAFLQRLLLAPISTGANAPLERRESDPLDQHITLLPSLSIGANAPIKCRESDPVPHRSNAPRVEERRKGERRAKSIETLLPRHYARRNTPAVLAVPSRVAIKMQAVAHASRVRVASRHDGARDLLPMSRVRPSLPSYMGRAR